MKIGTSFEIPSPPDEAYRFLLDVEQVAPCVPGGELGPPSGDGSYPAKVTVRLGPMRIVYSGSLRIAERDDAGMRAVLRATARETGGQGSVEAAMRMHVAAAGEGSRVDVIAELTLTGRAARMGRGLVEDVARRVVADMAACLKRKLADGSSEGAVAATAAPSARPVPGIRLLLRLFLDRLRGVEPKGET
jgi:carbon monoxide dehydrogenase subunit G